MLPHHKCLYWTLAALFILYCLRLLAAFLAPFPLQVDEAQYAGWAHDLAAGYYSKPPLIAWAIGAGQGVCSALSLNNVAGCARMLQAPAFLLSTLFLMATAWQLFSNIKVTLITGVLFSTLPFVGFYSLVATTDAWLLCWWSMALLGFVCAQKENAGWLPWLCCGLALGLGLLTKYSMALFAVSAFIYLIVHKKLFSIKPWVAGVLALVVFLPNLIWNAQNGFPTLSHHVDISQVAVVEGGGWSLGQALLEFVEFFSAQFGVFGPFAFLGLLVISIGFKKRRLLPPEDANGVSLLLTFIWPMLGLIMLQAVMSRAHANWAVPAYAAGSMLVAYGFGHQWSGIAFTRYRGLFSRYGLNISVAFGLAISVFLMAMPYWVKAHPEVQYSHLNPLRKLQGWDEVAMWAKSHLAKAPMRVIAEDRSLLAALSAYGYPEAYPPLAWNPRHQHDSHYRWFYDVAKANVAANQTMLFIWVGDASTLVDGELQRSFNRVTPIQDAALSNIALAGNHQHAFAFEVSDFKGYQ